MKYYNSVREREPQTPLLTGLSQGSLWASWARWETHPDEPRAGGLSPEHFQIEERLLLRKHETHDGMQGKNILGLYKTYFGVLRGGKKGRGWEVLMSFGEEQVWQNRGKRGKKGADSV